MRMMRVETWHWDRPEVRAIMAWDPVTGAARSHHAQKRLKRDVGDAFESRIEDDACDRFEAAGGHYRDEDDPLADFDFTALIGAHYQVRFYPYWFTGLVTGWRPAARARDGRLVHETLLVEMVSVGIDPERDEQEAPAVAPAQPAEAPAEPA